jgi:glycosyltransferase involved in cell wall biosynthesis
VSKVMQLLADAAWWVAALFLALGWVVALVNARTFPSLARAAEAGVGTARAFGAGEAVRVSMLIPARDEIATLPSTVPTWLAQGADEVIVLDDGSSDGTGAFLAALAADEPRLRVLDGAPLPTGWSGKNWACHQLAAVATGDLLVFTDADVRWAPGALTAVRSAIAATGADLLTCWPRQRCETLGERMLVPLVDMLLLTTLPAPLARWQRLASATGANGQCMAWRRGAYDRYGGHAALRAEVLEDVRTAQRVKRLGGRVVPTLGRDLITTRMYAGYTAAVRGFAKNILAAAGHPAILVVVWTLNVLTYTLSWPLIALDARWLGVALAGVGLRALSNAIAGRAPIEALLQPFGPAALLPVIALALRWRGGYEWRGRRYA